MRKIGRRDFLTASAGLAISAAAPLARAQGNPTKRTAANEKVILGAIGLGGRGTALIKEFAERDDVEVAYLCDLDPSRGREAFQSVARSQKNRIERVTDYRRLLDATDVDAVVVATPDHWHALAAIHACQAGKDVYVEKPPSHNVWEGRKMVEAARRYDRVVQAGTQNRSAPYVIEARDYIRSGKLGKIHLCKVYNLKPGGPHRNVPDSEAPEGVDYDTWLGPAPKRPFNRRHFHGGWHAYWAYSGGEISDDGIHQLDIARWLTGQRSPKAVHCTGGNFAFDDDREVPDTQVASYDFDDMLMTIEMTHWAPYMKKTPGDLRMGDAFPFWPQNATRIEFYGTEGLMILGRHGGGWQVFTNEGEVVAERYGRFPDPPHKENFIQCVKNRTRPNADIEEGHLSASMIHLANISYRVGGRQLKFDAATESIVGDEEASALLKDKYRPPFVIPEKV